MKEMSKFETFAYFMGATAVLLAFLILKALSVAFDFWGLLTISVLFAGIDVLYFVAYRREKRNVTVKE